MLGIQAAAGITRPLEGELNRGQGSHASKIQGPEWLSVEGWVPGAEDDEMVQ
jgi:hypothetical protein